MASEAPKAETRVPKMDRSWSICSGVGMSSPLVVLHLVVLKTDWGWQSLCLFCCSLPLFLLVCSHVTQQVHALYAMGEQQKEMTCQNPYKDAMEALAAMMTAETASAAKAAKTNEKTSAVKRKCSFWS